MKFKAIENQLFTSSSYKVDEYKYVVWFIELAVGEREYQKNKHIYNWLGEGMNYFLGNQFYTFERFNALYYLCISTVH